ncbi:MAG TPA: ABC-2 family transporter protein [Pirellulales bacterium]|jgi:ABC-2 type transport system permease protein|nr:ABC-2 family transporter protein [Pirellulales bacterium]
MSGPNYLKVLATFARNSLVRDMTFRANFVIDCVSSLSWVLMNLGFYVLIFEYTGEIGAQTGWHKYEFFVFLSTTLFVNSLVQTFFMPNANEFSELIRTGNLDFALLKPIDTQFLISFERVEWSSLANFLFAGGLLGYALWQMDYRPPLIQCALYPIYLACGLAILYSLMIVLSSISVWLGRNQSLYDFWFYITNFSRYPMEIYRGAIGTPLRLVFTFVVPILVVVNVPARLLAKPLDPDNWWLAAFGLVATAGSVLGSRAIFNRALTSYRSASS